MKKALICGISGQDGAYLTQLLLAKHYEVHGTSRDRDMSSFTNLQRLGVKSQVQLHSMAMNDFRSVLQTLHRVQPDEIYNLAGQTSVGLSFEQPVETLESIATGTLNLLEALRFMQLPAKIYNACSSECFGDTLGEPADENTPFKPRSPYAIAKSTAFWEVANYREAYNIFACNGILFNHESPLRPERFVTQKIVATARKIAQGGQEKLALGRLDVARDWGYAPEFVEAMWRMLQQDQAEDFVIATGETHTLEAFVAGVFDAYGLDWRAHVVQNPEFFRPTDLAMSRANPAKAKAVLGWQAQTTMPKLITLLTEPQ